MRSLFLLFLPLFFFSLPLLAQDEEEEDEDFSMYEDFANVDGKADKKFAAPKIIGLSPAKLISVGYDTEGPNILTRKTIRPYPNLKETNFAATHGLRILFNLPVVSNTRWLINVGGSYIESNFISKGSVEDPLGRVLSENGLRSMGLNTTVFKPLNEKTFLLGYVSADLNGDYSFRYFQSLHHLRYSWTFLYGKRPHDRLQYAIGVSQSYRAGEVNYFPTILYNYTSANRKWGVEFLLPAKAHVRRKLNARNILLLGYELEGQTYRLNDRNHRFPPQGHGPAEYTGHYNPSQLELRRSEIRARLIYEKGFSDFIWISAQFGYVINYRYKIDNGEFFRGFFNDQPYVMEYKLSNPLYINFSINLVSP